MDLRPAVLAFVSTLILLYRYRQSIFEELHEFVGSKASIFIGAFLIAVSTAFVVQTDNFLVTLISVALTIVGVLTILGFFVHQLRQPRASNASVPENA